MSWTLEFPWPPLLALVMLAWGLWARWKQKKYMGSRGKLIFTISLLFCSAFYALVSVSKFSAGQTWLGAAYLVIALGLGLVILLYWLISRQGRGELPENVG